MVLNLGYADHRLARSDLGSISMDLIDRQIRRGFQPGIQRDDFACRRNNGRLQQISQLIPASFVTSIPVSRLRISDYDDAPAFCARCHFGLNGRKHGRQEIAARLSRLLFGKLFANGRLHVAVCSERCGT